MTDAETKCLEALSCLDITACELLALLHASMACVHEGSDMLACPLLLAMTVFCDRGGRVVFLDPNRD